MLLHNVSLNRTEKRRNYCLLSARLGLPMSRTIYLNGRFKSHRVTGLQRYAQEVSARLASQLEVCQPAVRLRGWRGHLWEQTVLPLQSRSGLLWSPCASGPLLASNHVVTLHDIFPLESPQWYSQAFVDWYRVMLSSLAKRSRHIIAVSHYTKSRLRNFFDIPEEKITVVYHGVDGAFACVTQNQVLAARAALQLPSPNYFLFVGSLEPRKNLSRLLAAWSGIVNELPSDLWLIVAGAADLTVHQGSGLAHLPERVHMAGYVPDLHLHGLYAGSSALLYPSLAEGFGFPPLEAMAAGVPVLTSNVTALPEICGAAAIYVDPRDVHSIAKSLLTLARDPSLRTRLADLGRTRAREFTWERTTENTLRVLKTEAQRLDK